MGLEVHRMRFIVRPLQDPDSVLDVTDAVIDAVARRLALAFGGNDVLNRLEAAAHLESLLRNQSGALRVHGARSGRMREVPAMADAAARLAGDGTADDTDLDLEELIDERHDSRTLVSERQQEGQPLPRLAFERIGRRATTSAP
jgi:hypothetical protein